MKIPFVFAAFVATVLLLPAANTLGQNSPTTIRWSEGAPNARLNVENGTRIEGLKTDSVEVFANFAEVSQTDYNRAWVQVINHGKDALDFHPESATLQNTKGKAIPSEPPDKTAKSIQKLGESESQELSSAHCDLMTAVGCQPTNTQMQQSKQVLEFANKQAEWVRANGLTQKSLAPGDQIQGAIFFKTVKKDKKEKKESAYILRVPAGDHVFEFPFSAPAHK